MTERDTVWHDGVMTFAHNSAARQEKTVFAHHALSWSRGFRARVRLEKSDLGPRGQRGQRAAAGSRTSLVIVRNGVEWQSCLRLRVMLSPCFPSSTPSPAPSPAPSPTRQLANSPIDCIPSSHRLHTADSRRVETADGERSGLGRCSSLIRTRPKLKRTQSPTRHGHWISGRSQLH